MAASIAWRDDHGGPAVLIAIRIDEPISILCAIGAYMVGLRLFAERAILRIGDQPDDFDGLVLLAIRGPSRSSKPSCRSDFRRR